MNFPFDFSVLGRYSDLGEDSLLLTGVDKDVALHHTTDDSSEGDNLETVPDLDRYLLLTIPHALFLFTMYHL